MILVNFGLARKIRLNLQIETECLRQAHFVFVNFIKLIVGSNLIAKKQVPFSNFKHKWGVLQAQQAI